MSTKRSMGRFAGVFLLPLVSAAQLACGGTAHDFVQAKTGIDVGPEVRLCSNGVLHDDPSCRPNGGGGMPWVRNENFDIFPVNPVNRQRNLEGLLYLAKQRYLGTPYWRGHLQPACKPEEDLGPAAVTAVDFINLAARLDEEINRSFVGDALASFGSASAPIDGRVEAAFRDALRRIVEQKIHVALLWFVTTYTGGRYAMALNPALARCNQDVLSHTNDGAQFVTGVAGFIVLENQADVSINSAQNVAEALNVAVGGSMPVIDAKLTGAWQKTVGNVIHVDTSTFAMTQTVYPLWVQFE